LGSPNGYDGFGLVQIGNLLKDAKGSNLDLKVVEAKFSSSSEAIQLCYKMTSFKYPVQLKATLAWYDYPSSVSAVPTMINDLDLIANTYSKNVNTGANSNFAIVLSNSRVDGADAENNVERLILNDLSNNSPTTDTLMVSLSVYNYGITGGSQNFSLLVSFPQGSFVQAPHGDCIYDSPYATGQSKDNLPVVETIEPTESTSMSVVVIGITSTIAILSSLGFLSLLAFVVYRKIAKRRQQHSILTEPSSIEMEHTPYYRHHQ